MYPPRNEIWESDFFLQKLRQRTLMQVKFLELAASHCAQQQIVSRERRGSGERRRPVSPRCDVDCLVRRPVPMSALTCGAKKGPPFDEP
jgi:hypothetical protein